MQMVALCNKKVAILIPYPGLVQQASNQKEKNMLSEQTRSTEEAVLATANNLIDIGIVRLI